MNPLSITPKADQSNQLLSVQPPSTNSTLPIGARGDKNQTRHQPGRSLDVLQCLTKLFARREKVILANCVSCWTQAMTNWGMPKQSVHVLVVLANVQPIRAPSFCRLVGSLSICARRQFCLCLLARPPEMKCKLKGTSLNLYFLIMNKPSCAKLGGCKRRAKQEIYGVLPGNYSVPRES